MSQDNGEWDALSYWRPGESQSGDANVMLAPIVAHIGKQAGRGEVDVPQDRRPD